MSEEEVSMRLKPEEVRIINAVRGLHSGKIEVFKNGGQLQHLETRQRFDLTQQAQPTPPAPGQVPRRLTD